MTHDEFMELKAGDAIAFITTRQPEWRVVIAGPVDVGKARVRITKVKKGWLGPPHFRPDWVDYDSSMCGRMVKRADEVEETEERE